MHGLILSVMAINVQIGKKYSSHVYYSLDFLQVLLSWVLYEDCMTFLPEFGALYFSTEKDFSLFEWMHNDFMYVRFGGMSYKDLEQV